MVSYPSSPSGEDCYSQIDRPTGLHLNSPAKNKEYLVYFQPCFSLDHNLAFPSCNIFQSSLVKGVNVSPLPLLSIQ